MSELTPELAPDVVAACKAGAEEAAAALSRSLDAEFTLSVGEAGSYDPDTAPDGFDGAGLALLMKFGNVGAAVLLPETSGLLPDWYANPDSTDEHKLSALAQELSMLLMPETLLAEDFKASRVASLSDAVASAEVAADATIVALKLSTGDSSAQLSLLWPLASPDALLPVEIKAESPEPAAATALAPASARSLPIQDFSHLPRYSRSLLRIELQLHVVLATKKESLKDIIELASGSIIKFDKSCDEMLLLQIGDQKVAEGEAVKVGDKFGFRVSNMVMPDEHFMKVQSKHIG